MSKQQQQFIENKTLQVVLSIIVLIILVVIFAIQISILVGYYVDQSLGRCIFKDNQNNCVCTEQTLKKSCDQNNGIFRKGLSCNDPKQEMDCKTVLE